MKWTIILLTGLLTSCICTNTEVLESKQVIVPPPPKLKHLIVKDTSFTDVTNNTVKFY